MILYMYLRVFLKNILPNDTILNHSILSKTTTTKSRTRKDFPESLRGQTRRRGRRSISGLRTAKEGLSSGRSCQQRVMTR